MDSRPDLSDSEQALSERLWEAPEMNIGFNSKSTPESCAHARTLIVISAGLTRDICEFCGHVSVNFTAEMVGGISRDAFSRDADDHRLELSPRAEVVRHLVITGG